MLVGLGKECVLPDSHLLCDRVNFIVVSNNLSLQNFH